MKTSECNYSSVDAHLEPYYEGVTWSLLYNFVTFWSIIQLFSYLNEAFSYGNRVFYDNKQKTGCQPNRVTKYSWIWETVLLSDKDFLQVCGIDALRYLLFQRILILIGAVVTYVSLIGALPINYRVYWTDDFVGNDKFHHSTLANLDPGAPAVWALFGLALVLLVAAIVMMRVFSIWLMIPKDRNVTIRTLMIRGILNSQRTPTSLRAYLHETYPDIQVECIQFAYKVGEVLKLEKKREFAQTVLSDVSVARNRQGRKRLRTYQYAWEAFCAGFCCCKKFFFLPLDIVVEYYTRKESKLSELVAKEKIKAVERPVSIAFVTFRSAGDAKRVLSHPKKLSVCVAPPPNDIIWENLEVSFKKRIGKQVAIVLGLFVVMLVLIVPAVCIQATEYVEKLIGTPMMSAMVYQFVPAVLLKIMAIIMPALVSVSGKWAGHWTKSTQNLINMIITLFFFTLFVILPAIGLTSTQVLIKYLFYGENIPVHCVFMPKNGAFFVNYMITTWLSGTALELLRPGDMLQYLWMLICSKSKVEIKESVRQLYPEFDFGGQYASLLLNFSIMVTYSISVPYITPFGLAYLLFKHSVDKHNLYFVHKPTRCNKNIHTTAAHLVTGSFFLLQLSLWVYASQHYGFKGVAFLGAAASCFTFAAWLAIAWLHCFQWLCPVSHPDGEAAEPDLVEETAVDFLPGILEGVLVENHINL